MSNDKTQEQKTKRSKLGHQTSEASVGWCAWARSKTSVFQHLKKRVTYRRMHSGSNWYEIGASISWFQRYKPLSHEHGNEWVSKRANERSGARELSKPCGASDWVSGANKWTSTGGRVNGLLLCVSISYWFKGKMEEPTDWLKKGKRERCYAMI